MRRSEFFPYALQAVAKSMGWVFDLQLGFERIMFFSTQPCQAVGATALLPLRQPLLHRFYCCATLLGQPASHSQVCAAGRNSDKSCGTTGASAAWFRRQHGFYTRTCAPTAHSACARSAKAPTGLGRTSLCTLGRSLGRLGCCLGAALGAVLGHGCCLGCSLGRRLGLCGKSHPLGPKGESIL